MFYEYVHRVGILINLTTVFIFGVIFLAHSTLTESAASENLVVPLDNSSNYATNYPPESDVVHGETIITEKNDESLDYIAPQGATTVTVNLDENTPLTASLSTTVLISVIIGAVLFIMHKKRAGLNKNH